MKGKYALITGASSGMGEALSYGLGSRGVNLYLLARRGDKLKDLAKQIKSEYLVNVEVLVCDLSDVKQVDKTVKQVVKAGNLIDYFFSCAGYGIFKQAQTFNRSEVDRLFNVNTIAPIHLTQSLLSQKMISKGGHLFYLASMAGKVATPSSSVYSATKSALIKYADALRMELKPYQIGVTTVNPGPVATPFFSYDEGLQNYLKQVQKWALSTDQVVDKILKVAQYQPTRREINLPYSLAAASILSHLFPKISDQMILSLFNYK